MTTETIEEKEVLTETTETKKKGKRWKKDDERDEDVNLRNFTLNQCHCDISFNRRDYFK